MIALVTASNAIREATPADAHALARMRYAFRVQLDSPIEPQAAFEERCTKWMAERLESKRWRCWIAEHAGRPAGQLWLQVIEKIPNPVAEREAHAYVTNVYVEPALRGQGTGGQLLEAAIAWCRAHEVDAVILWPTPESRTLYERHGFAVSDDLMQLRLGPPGFKS